ncbi:MAG: UDP-3-O-(3-hydroxymyristoyl)glucosamine N-acyltransferase [Acidobacteria bacterium]|nr:UDP-3-O-(3-hydroxymyristoyl)glucosamine N-acyltransferase [Acidobacteriota bacterium]
MAWTLGRLAERVGGEVAGDPERSIEGIRALDAAGPGDLSFLTHPKYVDAARQSAAGAILLAERRADLQCDQLVVADPSRALATLIAELYPESPPEPGVHATAVVGEGSDVDPSAHLGAYVVLGRRVRVAARAVLHPHVVVGDDCVVGEGAVLHPQVVLYRRTKVGAGSVIHAGAVLGADGFGYATEGTDHRKIPQVGDVVVGAEVEIGANSAVDRALLGSTEVGDGSKIDNLVQVGHNVRLGRGVILCGQVGIAGSARLRDGVVAGGQAGVVGHLEVGAAARIASRSAVYEDVAPGETVSGHPAVPIGAWRRQQALMRRLGEIWSRLRKLERAATGPEEKGEE